MKYFPFLLFIIILASSCSNNSQQGANTSADSTKHKENLFIPGYIHDTVAKRHRTLEAGKGNYQSFCAYLTTLDTASHQLTGTALALDYINTCIPATADAQEQDKVFFVFNNLMSKTVEHLSQMMADDYGMTDEKTDSVLNTANGKAYVQNLSECGIELASEEGYYYADVQADFLNANFKKRVSPPLKELLSIRTEERAEGFADDGGLVITFDEAYKQAKKLEALLQKYPKSIITPDAEYYYRQYMDVVLNGMDNTPLFDSTLTDEGKALYEKIRTEDRDSRSGRIISAYYDLLYKNQFREPDSMNLFMKENNIDVTIDYQPRIQ